MTHSATLLVLDALACFRLTRLITVDTILAPLRLRLAGSRPGISRDIGAQRIMIAARPRLAEFITCPWCVSPYIAAVVVLAQTFAPGPALPLTALLSFSAVAGLIAEHT